MISFDAQKREGETSFKCSILSHTLLTRRLHKLVISKPKGYTYEAGQYVTLYLKDGSARLYSIASAPHQSYIEFHIQEPLQDNILKTFLNTLTINQSFFISEASGTLARPSSMTNPMILIAGGYALAPFKGIIEDFYRLKKVPFPVYLFWGLSHLEDVYYIKELQEIKNTAPWFNYQIILSNHDTSWSGKVGNLVDLIFTDFNNLEEFTFHVCGSVMMVKDMYRHALQHKLKENNFYSDYDLKIMREIGKDYNT